MKQYHPSNDTEIDSPGAILISTSSITTQSIEYTDPEGVHYSYSSQSRGHLISTFLNTNNGLNGGTFYIMHTSQSNYFPIFKKNKENGPDQI